MQKNLLHGIGSPSAKAVADTVKTGLMDDLQRIESYCNRSHEGAGKVQAHYLWVIAESLANVDSIVKTPERDL